MYYEIEMLFLMSSSHHTSSISTYYSTRSSSTTSSTTTTMDTMIVSNYNLHYVQCQAELITILSDLHHP